jgi:glycosyltransferase involved in cell wall biosynthesis
MVVLPAYNAAATLEKTIAEIPGEIVDDLLLVDDASNDGTVEVAARLGLPHLVHPRNRGYGGNQKTCYTEALRRGADICSRHAARKSASGSSWIAKASATTYPTRTIRRPPPS